MSLPRHPGRRPISRFKFCSVSGSAAVCHLDAAGSLAVSVFDTSGAQVASTPSPDPQLELVTWGPGGKALVLQCEGDLWLWDLAASAPVRVASYAFSELAWATPHTGSVVFQQPSSSSGVLVGTASASTPLQACVLQGTASCVISLAWGTRLAVLTADSDNSRWGTLQVFPLLSQASPPVASSAASSYSHSPCACVSLAVSSDGELLAAVIGVDEPEQEYEDYEDTKDSSPDSPRTVLASHLMVMHLSSGRLNSWSLWEPMMLGGDLHLRWAVDCTAVLVTDQVGCSVLYSFVGDLRPLL